MTTVCPIVPTMPSHGMGGWREFSVYLAIGTMVALAMLTVSCAGAPTTFEPSDSIPMKHFSAGMFGDILRDHVRDGDVDYPAIRKDLRFADYLALLNRVDPNQFSRDDGFAFWINAYNAFAIQGILDGLTPAPYLGWYRYFHGREYQVGGRRLTLSVLEHDIIRKQFREPRMHFAIVCASSSCPKLQSWAYQGEQLNQQLDRVAREFINDSSRNRFDRASKTLYLSKIFGWFTEDFEAEAGSLPKYLARYVADAELAKELMVIPYRIEYLEYDWSLNGRPPEPRNIGQ